MASSAFALASVAAQIQTAGQLRAAMGAVTTTLSEAYAQLPNISSLTGERDQAQQLLDIVNKSAGILYAIFPADGSLDDQEISTSHAISAAHVIYESNDALKEVESNVQLDQMWDIAQVITDALSTVGGAAGSGLQKITNAVAAGATAFVGAAWPTLLLVAFGIVIFFWARARILRKLVG